jgi:hypothetical protein
MHFASATSSIAHWLTVGWFEYPPLRRHGWTAEQIDSVIY